MRVIHTDESILTATMLSLFVVPSKTNPAMLEWELKWMEIY